jgi:hypothetical protein
MNPYFFLKTNIYITESGNLCANTTTIHPSNVTIMENDTYEYVALMVKYMKDEKMAYCQLQMLCRFLGHLKTPKTRVHNPLHIFLSYPTDTVFKHI